MLLSARDIAGISSNHFSSNIKEQLYSKYIGIGPSICALIPDTILFMADLSSSVPLSQLRLPHRPKVILTDIDDTLTDDGKLSPNAYAALWRLTEAGTEVVPITGRPAGWCDLIVRQWPVAGVVGENGAFAMYLTGERRAIQYHPAADRDAEARLEELRQLVQREVPEARIASDQPFRMFDLAIDFAEDEPDLGLETAQRIHEICTVAGAEARISSIHVNAWFGDYTKLDMSLRFLSDRIGIMGTEVKSEVVFVGDSPNDEPMFAFFPLSVAVAGVRRYAEMITQPPRYITETAGGAGFVELVDKLLAQE